MTATTQARVVGPRRVDPAANRAAAWRNSWQLALRIGRREIRRARGRSALIMIMVGAPVLVIIAGVTWAGGPSSRSALAEDFGNAQASVQVTSNSKGSDSAGQPQDLRADKLGSMIAGHVVKVTSGQLGIALGSQIRVSAIGMPVGEMDSSGLFRLRSGHWPTRPDQILVTRDFSRGHHLSSGDVVRGFALDQASDPITADLQIVGVVALPRDGGGSALPGSADIVAGRSDLITPSDPSEVEFLIFRKTVVGLGDVHRLASAGLQVTSRYLVEHPDLDPDQTDAMPYSGESSADTAFYVLLGAGLLFESMLLAGPAFAISAARQRHTMGLIASNGAMRDQLRRQLLGQALILGVLAGAVGVGLGLLVGRYATSLEAWLTGTWAPPAGLTWQPAVIAFLGAAVAAVVAAVLPARGVGKLDLVAVLRRRTAATRTRSYGPWVGLVLLAAGLGTAVGLGFRAPAAMGPRYLMGACTAAAFIGAMLILPWLVSALGRLTTRMPLSVRLAGRDAARQLGRNVPAMAAVLAASGMFVIMAIAIASDDRVDERNYLPETAIGQGTVSGPPDGQATINIIRARHPDWRITPRTELGGVTDTDGLGSTVALVPVRCTPQQAVTAATDAGNADPRCAEARNDFGPTVAVVPDNQSQTLGLPAAAQRVLDQGGIVLVDPPIAQKQSGLQPFGVRSELVTDDAVTVVVGQPEGDGDHPAYHPESSVSLPATVIAGRQLGSQQSPEAGTFGWISETAADRAGLPTRVIDWNIAAPSGAITVSDEKAINELVPPGGELRVERGYQSPMRTVGLVLLAICGLLVTIAALISTALSQVEARPDLATLAAVGAPPGLRRRFAAAQAIIIVLLGIVAGVIVGLVAGIAFAATNTREYSGGGPGTPFGPPVISVPWELPGALLIGAMAIAGLLAVLGAWKVPSMTRRLG